MSNTETNTAAVATAQTAYPTFAPASSAELDKCALRYSRSGIVPKQFQGNPDDCFIALEMAYRMGASPMALMQNMYIVYGSPSFSSKFLIAAFNTCGRFTAIKYRMTGVKGTDTYGCVAYATEKATNATVESDEVTMRMAKAEGWATKTGSKWQTMPGLMLRYRAATFLIRTTAPEITMGLPTTDELEDIGPRMGKAINVTPKAEPKPEIPKPAIAPNGPVIEAQAVDMETGELLAPPVEAAKPVSAPKTKAKPQPAF